MPSEYSGPDPENWARDRADEGRSLPYAGTDHYPSDAAKALDLGAAERNNKARAAGEVGATVAEWEAIRAGWVSSGQPMRDVTEADVRAYQARQAIDQSEQ